MIVTPQVEAALNQDHHEYCHFVKFEFNGVDVCLTDASFDIEWNGDLYLGNGALLAVGDVTRTTELVVNELGITSSLADQSLLAILVDNNQKGRHVKMYRAYFDDSGIIPDPVLLNWGEVSGISTSMGVDTGTLKTKVSGPFAQWSRKKGRRTNNASQQSFYPADRGMEYATQINPDLNWGGE